MQTRLHPVGAERAKGKWKSSRNGADVGLTRMLNVSASKCYFVWKKKMVLVFQEAET